MLVYTVDFDFYSVARSQKAFIQPKAKKMSGHLLQLTYHDVISLHKKMHTSLITCTHTATVHPNPLASYNLWVLLQKKKPE